MRPKLVILSFVLSLSLLSGCSEGIDLLNKVTQLINQLTSSEEAEGQDSNNTVDENAENLEQTNDETDANESNKDSSDGSGGTSNSVEAKEYDSEQGDAIQLALGEKSFASTVIDYIPGDPAPTDEYADPLTALGEPDYNSSTWEGFVSLGGGGQLIVEFEEAYLINGPGDDLFIFEVGPSVEAMEVEISTDGAHWIHLGEISGGTASIDIEPYIESQDDRFSFVKLTDSFSDTGGDTPGADIDAIAIINGELK